VYRLFREFSWSILNSRSLFSGLPHREQIPDGLTALLALKHPDVALLSSRLFMEAFEQIGGPDQGM
jgi:hypothetical protein